MPVWSVLQQWFTRQVKAPHPLLARFNQFPRPAARTLARQCPLLAIDLETTGLNPRRDHIVSIAWVPIREAQIILSEARYYLIQSPVGVGQSATLHGLLDRDLKDARTLDAVLAELLTAYPGYVWAAHHAPVEQGFLSTAISQHFGGRAELPFIDTLALERKQMERAGTPVTQESLQLAQCLRRRGLPAGRIHHALEDAYGCALLCLAQLSRAQLSLGECLRQSRY